MRYGLALMGFGGVNRALVQIIEHKAEHLKKEHGIELFIASVSDLFLGFAHNQDGLDIKKLISLPTEKGVLATLDNGVPEAQNDKAISAEGVDIVVEATFTNPKDGEPAVSHCRYAIENYKHIVTTNKGPVALFGHELSKLARERRLGFEFEGSVMSGTPVISFASKTLKGCDITGFRGILNGTANFILERVENGASMQDAIKEAQDLGYAEADPTADVEGYDVMLKVGILANHLLGANIKANEISRKGISNLQEDEIRSALQENKKWKLIGQGNINDDGELETLVAPQLLSLDDPLAGISGPTNAVSFDTDLLGNVTVSGPGAGKIETGYALLADIISIHDKNTSSSISKEEA